jgi:DNA helicase HerA-like ATPase
MKQLSITTGKPSVPIPAEDAATHQIAIIARTGQGKTHTAKNLAEIC